MVSSYLSHCIGLFTGINTNWFIPTSKTPQGLVSHRTSTASYWDSSSVSRAWPLHLPLREQSCPLEQDHQSVCPACNCSPTLHPEKWQSPTLTLWAKIEGQVELKGSASSMSASSLTSGVFITPRAERLGSGSLLGTLCQELLASSPWSVSMSKVSKLWPLGQTQPDAW